MAMALMPGLWQDNFSQRKLKVMISSRYLVDLECINRRLDKRLLKDKQNDC